MKIKKIKLGKEVVVSDPCYEIPTWCQCIISDVIPGTYKAFVHRIGDGDDTIKSLIVVHEDVREPVWKVASVDIGVDSGQCGIFCSSSYRNDKIAKKLDWLTKDGNPFGNTDHHWKESGEHWYDKMCDRTLNKPYWGTYDTGVVSSSGYGDSCYILECCELHGQVNGFRIQFINDDEGIEV